MITLLDGPLGTELNRRGVATQLPSWSAAAIESAPEVIAAIHADYADAGATVHTANTFRTKQRTVGDRWQIMTERAVELTRQSVPSNHRVAGSIAPLEDCYCPDQSPGAGALPEHQAFAEQLENAGVDLLLCETFPNPDEALAAVTAARNTSLETWLALTAGPDATLMSPAEMVSTAKQAVDLGAAAILVNCTPAVDTLRFLAALADAALGVPIGAYANAGCADDQIGWTASAEPGAKTYAKLARQWIDAGATLVGSCCGTTPEHTKAVRDAIN
ncbi:MAG: homocysteine S-methyltransferase family protein [Rubripirellula sp.]|nr:homocysteine S-methyltransferase family protein [Rubripirellula sp.]